MDDNAIAGKFVMGGAFLGIGVAQFFLFRFGTPEAYRSVSGILLTAIGCIVGIMLGGYAAAAWRKRKA